MKNLNYPYKFLDIKLENAPNIGYSSIKMNIWHVIYGPYRTHSMIACTGHISDIEVEKWDKSINELTAFH